jgi:5-hydroxyisourate hydrolase-like protein (transthyretin family)
MIRKLQSAFVRLVVCAGFAAVFAWTQDAGPQTATTPLVISGVVMEPGINQPVADAEITVSEFVRQLYKVTELAKGKTDIRGAFRFDLDKFATYLVGVNKAGYSVVGGDAQVTLDLNRDHPRREVQFSLVSTGELTGHVVDDETGMPIRNFHVKVAELIYRQGEPGWAGGATSPTDENGRFAASNRRLGNYLVQVVPQVLDKDQLQTQFTSADLEKVDLDYPNSYWPGGHDLDSASPVRIPSGGSVSAGTVRVKKVPFYRIHVSLPAGTCAPGEKIQVITEMAQFQTSVAGDILCDKDFLLRNYQSGRYLLYLLSPPGGGTPHARCNAV